MIFFNLLLSHLTDQGKVRENKKIKAREKLGDFVLQVSENSEKSGKFLISNEWQIIPKMGLFFFF